MNASPMLNKVFLALAAAFILSTPVFAAEIAGPFQTKIQSQDSLLADPAPADETPLAPEIEGAGPYIDPAEGSLGPDLWHDTPRNSISKLIEVMPVSSHIPAMQKMIFGILLTQADITMLKDKDTPSPPGQDLLTLRLNKLIEAGAYRQVLDLYSGLQLDNPPQSVAHAGILAMLFSGEKSLACVELNTLDGKFGEDDLFKTVAAYCDATLSEEPSEESLAVLQSAPDKLLLNLATKKDFSVIYSPAQFEKYTQLEKAMLTAEDRIKLSAQDDRNFKDALPTHIQILMQNSALTDKDKFILKVRALEWGLITQDDFKKSVLSAIDIDERKDPALAVPEKAEDWQKLPYLLQIAINKPEDADKWANIRQSFPIGIKYGLASLTPFAELIYKIQPEEVSFEEMKTAALVLNKGSYKIPPQWADIIDSYAPSESEKPIYLNLLAAIVLSDANESVHSKLSTALQNDESKDAFFIRNIIENVDISGDPKHTSLEIYENNVDLTLQQDYVMPSMGIWNRLPQAAQEGHIGETVLLSAAALRRIPLRETHPELFRDVLQSLKSVGLTEISRDLAIAAALGD